MECAVCLQPIPPSVLAAEGATCPGCGARLRVEAYPRLLHGVGEGEPPEPVTGDGEASCYVHAANQAVVPCSSCGRYLCTLCDLELDGSHVCPACLESGLVDPERLVSERTLWDRIVLSMAILPMVIFYFTVFTAPAALVLAVVQRRAPGSLVRGRRLNLWLGACIAVLQIVGWVAIIAFIVKAMLSVSASDFESFADSGLWVALCGFDEPKSRRSVSSER